MKTTINSARIEKTTNLGAGVVRVGGKTVFVDGAVAGDTADIEITNERAGYANAHIVRILSPSPHRVRVDCGAFGCGERGCGGCMFRHISYAHELEVKRDYIESCFHKCGLEVKVGEFLTAGERAVRTKVTAAVGGGVSGYYARGTNEIVPTERCLLHDEATDRIRRTVANANIDGVHHVTVRRGTEETMAILRADADAKIDKERVRALLYRLDADSVYIECGGRYELIAGEPVIYDALAGCRFRISPASFYQVNHDCAELLYERAIKAAALSPGERLADLYCGTGTIGIAAAKRVPVALTGIEIVPEAVADAKINARENCVEGEFICGDAAKYAGLSDCVIVDPPRAGCGRALVEHLLKMKPSRIIYVSCEPATLARDAKMLADAYEIADVAAVDMFPRTGKAECVCKLVLREKGAHAYAEQQ